MKWKMQDRSQTCSGPWTVSVSVKTQVRRRRTKTKFITEEESSKMVDSFFWTLVCSCLWLVVAFCIKWFINQQIYYYYFHFASRGRTLLASRVFHFFLVQERWCCLKDAIHGNPNWDLSLHHRRRRRSRRSKWLIGVVLSLTCFNRIIICYILQGEQE